jgi:HAD superfamily hydrolase (TIGR01484 family)
MQPIAQLAGVAPRLIGIFTDIDDTLTESGALVPAAYAEMVRAKSAGLRVVAVTGRPAGWAEVLAATWPLDAVVAENGAVAVLRSPGGAAGGHPRLTREFYGDAAERAGFRLRLDEIAAAVARRMPEVCAADDQWLRRCDLAFDIGEFHHLPSDRIAALRQLIESMGARTLTSTVHLHAFFGEHDKAKMLARVSERLWGERLAPHRDRYLFVGDSPNDQAAFSYFPNAAGPANVARYAAELDPPPAYVASLPGGRGFAEIVRLVMDHRDSPQDPGKH